MRVIILLFMVLLCRSVSGQNVSTRFYLPSTGSPGIIPVLSSNWTQKEGYEVRPLSITKTGSPFTQLTLPTPSVINTSTLFANYVSPPLAAQTINCQVTGQVRWRTSSATGIVIYTYVIINLISASGEIKANLLPPATGTYDFGAGLTSIMSPPTQPLISFVCADGDRLSIEFGSIRTSGTSIRTATMDIGDASSTDQLIGNSGGSAYNPWIEFSQTLLFYNGPAPRPRRVTIIQ